MKIYELPAEIQNRIFQLQTEAGNKPDANLDIEAKPEEGGFAWHLSPEGYLFWKGIWKGYYRIFYEKYPNKPVTVISKEDTFIKYILDCIENGPFTEQDFINFTKSATKSQTESEKDYKQLANDIINHCGFNLSDHNFEELHNSIVKHLQGFTQKVLTNNYPTSDEIKSQIEWSNTSQTSNNV